MKKIIKIVGVLVFLIVVSLLVVSVKKYKDLETATTVPNNTNNAPVTETKNESGTLQAALAAIPGDVSWIQSEKIDDTHFLVIRKTKNQTGDSGLGLNMIYEVWFVDTVTGKGSMAAKHELGPIAGTAVDVRFESGRYIVTGTITWEGEFAVKDFFLPNGTRWAATEWTGQSVKVSNSTDTVTIALSAKEKCEAYQGTEPKEMEVTGVTVNGQEIKFAKPRKATCTLDELSGGGVFPKIGIPYEYTGNKLYVALPFNEKPSNVIIDPANLTLAGTTLE